VPTVISGALPDPAWEQVWVKPGSEVWRVGSAVGDRYVKVAWDGEAAGLAAEAERLAWAYGRLPIATPEVVARADDDEGRSWLVTTALEGIPSHDPVWRTTALPAMVEALGDGLRRLHEADPTTCPFRLGVDELLASAERRVAAGGVDPTTMASPSYQRRSAEELLDHLRVTRPDEPAADLVVAHGDAVMPNLLIGPELTVVGMVDLGRLGVSDRHRDLALAVRALSLNVGPELGWRLFDGYGLAYPDPLRMEWYALADDMW
jgi:kanamycin kinase/aminoglycoside 3'-phosphotransferase-2